MKTLRGFISNRCFIFLEKNSSSLYFSLYIVAISNLGAMWTRFSYSIKPRSSIEYAYLIDISWSIDRGTLQKYLWSSGRKSNTLYVDRENCSQCGDTTDQIGGHFLAVTRFIHRATHIKAFYYHIYEKRLCNKNGKNPLRLPTAALFNSWRSYLMWQLMTRLSVLPCSSRYSTKTFLFENTILILSTVKTIAVIFH